MSKLPSLHNSLAKTVLCLSLLLPAAGCSVNYTGERLFWKAQRLSLPIGKNPSKATPAQMTAARAAYEAVIARAPGTAWAGRSQLAVGSLYAVEKDFPRARDAYALVLQNYNAFKELCLSARVAIAKTHELERHWDETREAYRDIAEHHPWSMPGLQAPLYIARIHEQHQQQEEATKAYERALRIYNKLLLDAPTPELATQVKGFLVMADQRLGRWDDAVKTLQELLAAPAGTNRPLALITLGAIYQTKLHDPVEAQAAFTTLVQEFPEHPFGKAAKAQLERMGVALPAAPAPSTATPPVTH